jgi:hypothetical protein
VLLPEPELPPKPVELRQCRLGIAYGDMFAILPSARNQDFRKLADTESGQKISMKAFYLSD